MAKTSSDRPRKRPAKGRRREKILEAAVRQFAREGFDAAKWASVAEEAGIGQTALYHYFESKVHCLLTVMTMELERSLERFKQATAGKASSGERLAAAVESAFDVDPRQAMAARVLVASLRLSCGCG